MIKKKHFPNQEELYTLYITNNLSVIEIANLYNTTINAVEHWLQRNNFKKCERKNASKPIDKDTLEDLYIVKKLKISKIVKYLNSTYTKVAYYLHKYNLKNYARFNRKDYTKCNISKEELYKLYIIENKTIDDIAKLLNKSRTQTRRYLRYYNIKKPKNKWIEAEQKSIKNRFGCSISNLEEIQEKIKQTTLDRYGVDNISKLEETKQKVIQTLNKNKTWCISIPEKHIEFLLKILFKNTKTQYYSKQYPFKCDFYIPELDLYIEYQGHQGHGKSIYDSTNQTHINLIDKWEKRASKIESQTGKRSKYRDYIKTWTIRDPLKRQIAKENNLNWLEFFTMDEFMNWYKKQSGIPLLEYKSSI